jgi:hypothetical protein
MNNRLLCRLDGMLSGMSSTVTTNKPDQDILGPSRLATIPLLHLCLDNATINASKINIHIMLPRTRATALAGVVNDGGISAVIMCEILRTVNGSRLGSLRYIQ